MKKTISAVLLFLLSMTVVAQKRTLMATQYREFRPSVVTFADGHKSRQSLTNVFLKNSSLLFLSGEYTMEANMDNIVAVDFEGDRNYIAIDKQLAYFVDSVKGNALYCIELFDQDSYERNLRNNVLISNLDMSSGQLSTSTIDINNEEDWKMPVFRHYFIRYNGEFIKVHERELNRKLPKEKRTMMKRVMALPDFSWQSEESLKQLLKVISDAESVE
jgi:hypothetical protein